MRDSFDWLVGFSIALLLATVVFAAPAAGSGEILQARASVSIGHHVIETAETGNATLVPEGSRERTPETKPQGDGK